MRNFDRIRQALQYIDDRLDQPVTFEQVAQAMHFSPFYFHRVFFAVVGKSITAHIRERRLIKACRLLAGTDRSVLDICLSCGFDSPQAFSRAFKSAYGVTPSAYRRERFVPGGASVDELIMRFTNRLKGGMLVHPNIIKRGELLIAGVTGDGRKTGQVWEAFSSLQASVGIACKVSDDGYEVRLQDGDRCDVHVGCAVSSVQVDDAFTVMRLPATEYASFDVYVAQGYDSQNNAMNEWLDGNEQGYTERLLDGRHYCVEFYGELFKGNEADSIVEIWIPIKK